MEVSEVKRKFKVEIGTKNFELNDPDPKMTDEEVCKFYSMEYPELINANVSDKKIENDELIITLSSKFKQKG